METVENCHKGNILKNVFNSWIQYLKKFVDINYIENWFSVEWLSRTR